MQQTRRSRRPDADVAGHHNRHQIGGRSADQLQNAVGDAVLGAPDPVNPAVIIHMLDVAVAVSTGVLHDNAVGSAGFGNMQSAQRRRGPDPDVAAGAVDILAAGRPVAGARERRAVPVEAAAGVVQPVGCWAWRGHLVEIQSAVDLELLERRRRADADVAVR